MYRTVNLSYRQLWKRMAKMPGRINPRQFMGRALDDMPDTGSPAASDFCKVESENRQQSRLTTHAVVLPRSCFARSSSRLGEERFQVRRRVI